MNDVPTTKVDINGIKLEVATYLDPTTTQAIASQVGETLKAIESSSERIDTQRFALEACMKIAVDLAQERDRATAAEEELGLQLASVNSSLESLLKLLD